MLDIFDFFLIGGIFCGVISSVLLFTQSRYQLHANRLVGIVIFTLTWYALLYLLIKTGWLSQVPGIYRVGSPLYYLIGPCSYLYVRSIIRDESKFRKWDWLHFLPAILHFIELIPFYLADAETKKQVVEAILQKFNNSYQKASGVIPAIWHFVFRPVHALIYLGFQWALLIRAVNRKSRYTIHEQVFSNLRTWLFSFSGLVTIIMLGLLVQACLGILLARSSVSITAAIWQMRILMTLAFFIISANLFFRPDILYGTLKTNVFTFGQRSGPVLPLPGQHGSVTPPGSIPAASFKDENPETPGETLLNDVLIKLYSGKIEEHLFLHQSFRRQGLSINQLAEELSMPVHHLSYVLNHHYKKRFNDFINRYRIDYVRQLFKEEEWRKMKLETLAAEAGFSSRSAFFAAFKKITGLTPADYAKQAGSNAG